MTSRVRARGGRLRAVAVGAGAALTLMALAGAPAGAADSPTAQAGQVTLSGAGSRATLRYGERLDLSGRVAMSFGGGGVRLEYAPHGGAWRPLAHTTADGDGSYRFSLRPARSGAFRAVSSGGVSSARLVTVVARLGGHATGDVRLGATVRVRGRLVPGLAGRAVRLQLATGHGWHNVDRSRTGRGGRYHARWHATGVGSYRLRVRFGGDERNAAVSKTLRGRVRVYRASYATWYGPGFYGHHTACGGILGYGTLGVAHRSLPCGTHVTFRYHGRSVTVPVIDRGPFGGGKEWDLTSATKRRLGFGDVGTVWVSR